MSTMPVLAIGSDRNWRARLDRILSGRGEVAWLGSRGPGEPGRGPMPSLLLLDGDDPRVERELQRLHVPMPQRLYFFQRPDVSSLRDCVHAGAAGCLEKEASPETVLRAIRSVGSGLFAVDPALLMQAMSVVPDEHEPATPENPPGNWSQLTERQREIVRWAAQGLSNKQIARHLGISPETVKSHLHHVFERAGVSGRMALLAMRWAEEAGHEDGLHEGNGGSGNGNGNGHGHGDASGNGAQGADGTGGSGRRDVA